ncbi:NAD(P)/FAD-dependent oxidoreductase [Acinetobacter calcoaceticus]|uniref:NAD(P)/FAD-dependent oxidoreductase n=1 Tax=Acinetobacter calcoaceticus TaxID=471 RepID=UPI0032B3DA46
MNANTYGNIPRSHRIVIVGGGAGGLELATRLGNSLGKRKIAEVILIDASLTHIWKPLLHEVASGTLNSSEDELNYFAHANKNNFEFFLGKMIEIDRHKKSLLLEAIVSDDGQTLAPSRAICFDTLVVAIGSTSNDFGTQGAKDQCIFLDSRSQADKFQKEFLSLYLKAQAQVLLEESSEEKKDDINIAIIGAGATGVELAAELKHAAHQFCKYGLKSIQPKDISITLIEASSRILPVLSEKVSNSAENELKKMGINVLKNCRVKRIDHEFIHFEDGQKIPANLKVWAAGIKAPDFLKNIAGLETNHLNQLIVRPTLQTTYDDYIFAMGDCACYVPEGANRAIPPRAQVANQQAIFLEKALKAHIENKELPTFIFKDKGSLISLSEHNSVGHILGGVNIEGYIARLMYVSLYRLHQVALHGMFKTSILILKDFLSKSSGPHLKMH